MAVLEFSVLALVIFGGALEDPQQDQYSRLKGDYAASHILITYRTAVRAPEDVYRNKPESLALAQEILAEVRKDPTQFEMIAREKSDGSTAAEGGYLGVVNWGKFDTKFEKAIRKMAPGQISGPVLTKFGYHLLRRDSLLIKNYAANLFVITYRGALNVEGIPYRRPNRKLTQAEAREKIAEYATSLTPENFEDIVEEHGDFRKAGGFYGNFRAHDTASTKQLSTALEKMDYGALTPIIELPFGLAVAQRVKVEKVLCARILMQHSELKEAPSWMTRSKQEALTEMEGILARIQKNPKEFAKQARKNSEGIYRGRGGVMPLWLLGSGDPKMDRALRTLTEGQLYAQVLDLPNGYAILKRLELKDQ